MNTVEMRKILREAGEKVPRSNEELEAAYNEFIANRDKLPEWEDLQKEVKERDLKPEQLNPLFADKAIKLVSSNIYTYVGKGDEPPSKIKFMDIQWFTRGVATEVKSELLPHVSKHACFVKGKVDMSEYYENDLKEKKRVEDRRFEDQKIQIEMERKNRRG